jgi:hypothetical protein
MNDEKGANVEQITNEHEHTIVTLTTKSIKTKCIVMCVLNVCKPREYPGLRNIYN